jgi:hypothetical protein
MYGYDILLLLLEFLLRFILVLYFHLRLGLQTSLLPSVFPIKIFYLSSHSCHVYLITLTNLNKDITWGFPSYLLLNSFLEHEGIVRIAVRVFLCGTHVRVLSKLINITSK